jgi:hypothetical protein
MTYELSTSGLKMSSGEQRGGRGRRIVENEVQARQGFRDRPVLWVLLTSLVLAVIAYIVIHFATAPG